ncbi:sulfite exporter TauE/SafE family protein [Patescibacteria group bacterium]|nr:sulfite exporter TauE/SafE family protein [Patescibacteria group bacterium]
MRKKTVYVSGMHCTSCEILLEKKIKEVKGVVSCQAHHKNGSVEVEVEGKFPYGQIKKAVQNCDYELVDKALIKRSGKRNSRADYYEIAVLFGLFASLGYILFKLELARFIPSLGSKTGLLTVFLIGVIASVSSCLALVGGIVASLGGGKSDNEGDQDRLFHRILPQIYFHLGRVASFVILGGVLGLVGSKINYSFTFAGYLTILVSVIMLYIGLQILNMTPSITKLGFHLPKGVYNKIDKLQENSNPLTPSIIGALTFFLPCGFTQSAQVIAMASGDFLSGAAIMGIFALGTLPVLSSVGIGSVMARKSKFAIFHKVAGVWVVLFALYSFNSGLVLAGFTSPLSYLGSTNKLGTAGVVKDVQVIKMDVDYSFKPTKFKIKKGVPVRWEINGINISGCTDEVIIPKLGISSGKLKKGLNVVEFTATKEGVLPFSCWMGMVGGQFIVTDD